MSTEITPSDGSLAAAASQFAGIFSAKPEEQGAGGLQPEQSSQAAAQETAQQAPAAPEQSESEQANTESPTAEESQAAAQPAMVTVVVDGQPTEVTLDEALKGYSRTQDYTRKTQALAQERREFHEKEVAALQAERQQYAQYLGQLRQHLDAYSAEPDWPTLKATMTPEMFAATWTEWDTRSKQIAAVKAEEQRIAEENQKAAQTAFTEKMQEQNRRLLTELPELADPKKGPELSKALIEHAVARGFEPKDLQNNEDYRLVLLLHDSMMLQRQKAKAPEIRQRVEKVLESPKPGANTQPAKSDAQKDALKRLEKSGRPEDAAKVFATIFN